MWFGVLGPLEVRTTGPTGEPVPIAGPARRRLLAALICNAGSEVSPSVLVEGLWGEAPPRSAGKTLQSHMTRLRVDLGDEGKTVLVTETVGYRLAARVQDIDATLFSSLVTPVLDDVPSLATDGNAGSGEKLKAAIDTIDEALALWRGDAYAEFSDSPFAVNERVRLGELRALAREARVDLLLTLGHGRDLVPELEQYVVTERYREHGWAQLATALYRAGRTNDSLGAIRRAAALLAEELGVDPGLELRELERRILQQDPHLVGTPQVTLELAGAVRMPADECPYRDLRGYAERDAAVFVGRERVVATVASALGDRSVVVVTGASGCGKTSLVRAGLIPALRGGALPGSARWKIRTVTPLDLSTGGEPETADLLVVDQFEETYSLLDDEQRQTVVNRITRQIDIEGRALIVVRGDYYARLTETPPLDRWAQQSSVLIGPMRDDELRRAITEPAASTGLSVDNDLVEAALEEVARQPEALPMLSVAMTAAWQHRDDHRLTLDGYRTGGGVSGAIEASANELYDTLTVQQQDQARQLLVRLAVQESNGWVRRPLSLAEATHYAEPDVLQALVSGRLVSADRRIQLAHESLLDRWPKLRDWLADREVASEMLDHLRTAAHAWMSSDRNATDLYRGARLQSALDWRSQHPEELTPGERDFLDASEAEARRELAEATARADREAAGRRRLRRVAVALALTLVLSALVSLAAIAERSTAQHRRATAEASALAADARKLAAQSLAAPDLRTRLLLGVAGYRLQDSVDSRSALLSALELSGTTRWRIATAGRNQFLGLDRSGAYLWTSDQERTVYRYSLATRKPVASFPERADRIAALSPDGAQLVVAGRADYFDNTGDGRISVLDATNGATKAVLPVRTIDSGAVATPAVFTADGKWLAVVRAGTPDADGNPVPSATVDVFETSDYRKPPRALRLDAPVIALAASAGAIDTISATGTVHVARASDLATVAATRLADEATKNPAGQGPLLAASSDGAYLAVTSETDPDQPYLLSVRNLPAPPRILERAPSGVADLAFSPTSRLLAMSAADGAVVVMRAADRTVVSRPLPSAPGQARHLAWAGTATADLGLFADGLDSQIQALDVVTDPRLVTETAAPIPSPDEVFRNGDHLVVVGPNTAGTQGTVSPVVVRSLDGREREHFDIPLRPQESLQGLSVDQAGDEALVMTQGDDAVMHATVYSEPSGTVLGHVTPDGVPSKHNNDVGVLSDDGKEAVFAIADHRLAVYSMPDGRRVRTFDIHFSGPDSDRHIVGPATFGPDGKLLIYGQDTRVNAQTPPGTSASAATAASAASADGSSPENQLVGLVDVGSGTLLGQVGGFGERGLIDAFAWSRDGSHVVVGTLAGTVRVLRAADLSPITPAVTAVAGAVQSVDFSPDGSMVVVGGSDGTLRLWDSSTLQAIGPAISEMRDDNWWAWFRPDGTVTGFGPAPADGTERWFTMPARPDEWVTSACALAGGNLSADEWVRYVGIDRPYRAVC